MNLDSVIPVKTGTADPFSFYGLTGDSATDHAASQRGSVQRARAPAFGTITAQSGRRNAVIAALTFTGGFSAIRQRLREWLYDGGRPLHAVSEPDRRPRPAFAPPIGAKPPFGKGQDVAARPAAVRTVAASAGGHEGRLPPRNPKPAPVSPLMGEGTRCLLFMPDFGWRAWRQPSGFPLSRE